MRIVNDQAITLIPLTHKGKNRIREHGDRWRVEGIRERVAFSHRPGPWLLIVAMNDLNPTSAGPAWRWIKESGDDHFEIREERVGSQVV